MVTTELECKESICNEQQIKPLFELFKANLMRLRIPFTVIFINVYDEYLFNQKEQIDAEKKLETYLASKIRETDLLFELSTQLGWGIILSQSSEKEANAFIQRVYEDVKIKLPSYQLELISSVVEIANDDVEYEEMLVQGKQALSDVKEIGPWHIEYVMNYKERKVETVKVSILDSNELFQEILKMSMVRIVPSHAQLEIRLFSAGDEFLESKWFLSSHRHIIIMNDILPRKNGFEVLKTLRTLPNDKRFNILMMTKRNSEEDMILAYENGVDRFLVKPFSIKLLEAQVKRTMERL